MYTQAQIEEFHLMSQRRAARRFLETPVVVTGFDELIELPKRRPLIQIHDFECEGREE